jgi:hypothetical protein
MGPEISTEGEIWQKICTAEGTWMEEIKDRHSVTISPDSDEVKDGLIFSAFSVSGAQADQACKDLTELDLRFDTVRETMGHIAGSTDWCKQQHMAMDLWGRTPIQAIHGLGLECIDCVLIGPVEAAAALGRGSEPVPQRANAGDVHARLEKVDLEDPGHACAGRFPARSQRSRGGAEKCAMTLRMPH